MSKPWLYWVAGVPPVIAALRDVAVRIGDGGEAERLNFSLPLALLSDPTTVVAYGGCSGPVGDDTREYLESLLDSGTLPGEPYLSWARIRNENAPARVIRTSNATKQARIDAGEVLCWDEPTALADAGLCHFQPVTPFHG